MVTRMDPTKVEGIKNWPCPKKVRDVRSLLGFLNFYRAFIPHFSRTAKCLNNLTRKDAPWQWGEEEEHAFNTLREQVTSEPVLR